MWCKKPLRAATLAFALAVILCCQIRADTGAAVAGGPKIKDVLVRGLSTTPKPRLRIAVLGENLGNNTATTKVMFDSQDPSQPVESNVLSVTPNEVEAEAIAPISTVINRIRVMTGGATAETKNLTISIKPSPPEPALKTFEIKLDPQRSNELPNLHSLLITKASGAPGIGFDANANRMQVEIEPPGVSDLRVIQSNEQQLELRFLAAADYKPKSAVITVYDSSDLDIRKPKAIAKMAPAELPADPNQPEISSVDTVFMNRSEGNGRIRLHGKNFGNYTRPDFGPVDDFLCQCLERSKVSGPGYRTCGYDYREIPVKICSDWQPAWSDWQATVGAKIIAGLIPRNETLRVEKVVVLDANDKLVDLYFEFSRIRNYAKPFRLSSVDLTIKKDIKEAKQTVVSDGVTVVLETSVPKVFSTQKTIGPLRSPDLVYRYTVLSQNAAQQLLGQGVSDNFYVFQLSVINNGAKKVTIPLAAIQVEVEWARGREFANMASAEKKDKPQAQQDKDKAQQTVGEKLAKVQGSARTVVIAQESEKVAENSSTPVNKSYLEGPPTLSPIPLAAVSGYFDAYEKRHGRRALVLNIFSGIATLATALVPFTGSAVKDGLTIFNNGVVPGTRAAWVDLSGQQLQNLTAMSWETSETLSANGGSMEKLVYVQRSAQFEGSSVTISGIPKLAAKNITNILDLEITGYEVIESKVQSGTPATSPATPPAPASVAPTGANTTPSSSGTTPSPSGT